MFAQKSGKWGDQGDGFFSNPILPGDYSDLDAIRVGSDFYAISSTMQFSPGMVVLHSKDLVNWEIISHVVDDLSRIGPELNWDQMNGYGKGVWAGSIRYYGNKYWVYFGTPSEGFFMSSANNPAGPWEPLQPIWSATIEGVYDDVTVYKEPLKNSWSIAGWDDCCSFCDDNGQLYFIATNFATDPKNNKKYNIHLFKLTPDGRQLIMESDSIINQSAGSEANKLYKINGLYYHYYSEVKGGTRVVMMERSKNIYGPWEIKQLNHTQKGIDPNQGGLIQLDNGTWWFFTHLGTGSWAGRVANLLPVTWVDGWPIIGEVGSDKIGNMVWSAKKPIKSTDLIFPQSSDQFNNRSLSVQWEWNYQPRADKWSLTERPGYMRLYAFRPIKPDDKRRILFRAGNTLTQRSMRTDHNEVTTKIDISQLSIGQYAGLCHFAGTYSTFGIRRTNGISTLVYDNNGNETTGIQITSNNIWLQSTWGFDGLSYYAYSLDGKNFTPFGSSYQLSWGNYRGDRIGIYSYNVIEDKGFIDVDWLRYNYADDKSKN